MDEPIFDYVKRRLRASGPRSWPAIGAEVKCSPHTLRKIAYNDADNPGIKTVQPLFDLFQAVDRGDRELPSCADSKAAA